MTTLQSPKQALSKVAQDALVDKLRACLTTEEILEFETWFNSCTNNQPLHELICELLRSRSISRGLAAKWLSTLIADKYKKIQALTGKTSDF